MAGFPVLFEKRQFEVCLGPAGALWPSSLQTMASLGNFDEALRFLYSMYEDIMRYFSMASDPKGIAAAVLIKFLTKCSNVPTEVSDVTLRLYLEQSRFSLTFITMPDMLLGTTPALVLAVSAFITMSATRDKLSIVSSLNDPMAKISIVLEAMHVLGDPEHTMYFVTAQQSDDAKAIAGAMAELSLGSDIALAITDVANAITFGAGAVAADDDDLINVAARLPPGMRNALLEALDEQLARNKANAVHDTIMSAAAHSQHLMTDHVRRNRSRSRLTNAPPKPLERLLPGRSVEERRKAIEAEEQKFKEEQVEAKNKKLAEAHALRSAMKEGIKAQAKRFSDRVEVNKGRVQSKAAVKANSNAQMEAVEDKKRAEAGARRSAIGDGKISRAKGHSKHVNKVGAKGDSIRAKEAEKLAAKMKRADIGGAQQSSNVEKPCGQLSGVPRKCQSKAVTSMGAKGLVEGRGPLQAKQVPHEDPYGTSH